MIKNLYTFFFFLLRYSDIFYIFVVYFLKSLCMREINLKTLKLLKRKMN